LATPSVTSAQAVPYQHDAAQLLVLQHRDDVLHHRRRADVGGQQVRPLAVARERRREHFVARRAQQAGDPDPAPPAVARAVHQHEGIALC
jgi:hypothetical protein